MNRVRVMIVAALLVAGFIPGIWQGAPAAQAATCGSAGPCFGPGDAAWDAYYANPADTSKWPAFCAGAGGSVVVSAVGVPACGPTGSNNIALKSGSTLVYTPGFQCVELTARYLYVTKGWTAQSANGARVARAYGTAHGVARISNGTAGKAPRVGDVMSFSSQPDFSDTGHAAVVSASNVDASGNGSVTILNQNVSVNGAAATAATFNLSVTNWLVDDLNFSYLEWLPLTTATVPAAPAAPAATAGNASASVSFQAPSSNGGSPITSYTVTASPGGATASGAASPLTVSGLTNGTSYTFTVRATNAVGTGPASPASNAVTPAAPPAPAQLWVGDASVSEGDAGLASLVFPVRLTAPAQGSVSVNFATANGSATAADISAVSGTLSFGAGQVSQSVSVPVRGDVLDEADETFSLNLTAPSGATLADGTGVGTIRDNDAASLAIGDVSLVEGHAGTGSAVLTVRLSAPATSTVSVNYATANGTATAPGDYTTKSGSLSFAAGQVAQTVSVTVAADAVDEAHETVLVNLSSPVGASLSDAQGQITIRDDDPGGPSAGVVVNDVTVWEGDAGISSAVFTVRLLSAPTSTVTLNYATANGTAVAPGDFVATSGTVTFSAGQTVKQVIVSVKGDVVGEANETLTFTVTNPSGQTTPIVDGSGVVTIRDNDRPATLAVGDVVIAEGNAGDAVATFTVQLTKAATSTVTVAFATANGTAVAPGDYLATSGSLSFSPGQTFKTVAVTIKADTTVEPDETVRLNLTSPSGAAVQDAQGIATIRNND